MIIICILINLTSMPVLVIVGSKCTAAPPSPHLVSHGEYADATDRQTGRRTDSRPLHYVFRYAQPK